jgi:hypothetical protein
MKLTNAIKGQKQKWKKIKEMPETIPWLTNSATLFRRKPWTELLQSISLTKYMTPGGIIHFYP